MGKSLKQQGIPQTTKTSLCTDMKPWARKDRGGVLPFSTEQKASGFVDKYLSADNDSRKTRIRFELIKYHRVVLLLYNNSLLENNYSFPHVKIRKHRCYLPQIHIWLLTELRRETVFLVLRNHVIERFGLACLGPERTESPAPVTRRPVGEGLFPMSSLALFSNYSLSLVISPSFFFNSRVQRHPRLWAIPWSLPSGFIPTLFLAHRFFSLWNKYLLSAAFACQSHKASSSSSPSVKVTSSIFT